MLAGCKTHTQKKTWLLTKRKKAYTTVKEATGHNCETMTSN